MALAAWAQSSGPSYSSAGLVHSATGQTAPLAPNTLVTLNGTNLSYSSAEVSLSQLQGGSLPTRMAGVRILIEGSTPAPLYSVSPTKIDFLIPASRLPGERQIQVIRDSILGPPITMTLSEVAPGLFQKNSLVMGIHADGSTLTADAPARPGDVVVLYATGLGETQFNIDPIDDGRIVPPPVDLAGIRIRRFDELSVLLNGTAVDSSCVLWAGLTPGFAGLYQINLQIPDTIDPDPEIRIVLSGQESPEGVILPAKP